MAWFLVNHGANVQAQSHHRSTFLYVTSSRVISTSHGFSTGTALTWQPRTGAVDFTPSNILQVSSRCCMVSCRAWCECGQLVSAPHWLFFFPFPLPTPVVRPRYLPCLGLGYPGFRALSRAPCKPLTFAFHMTSDNTTGLPTGLCGARVN